MEQAHLQSKVVRLAIRSWLLRRPDGDLQSLALRADWVQVHNLARLNKVGVIVPLGLQRSLGAMPAALERPAAAYRSATLQMNAANLATMGQALKAMQAEGVRCAVFKGPAQQVALYGDAFVKPAGDVDLLVASEDFSRASSALCANGFRLPPQFSSPWWWRALGEQHHQGVDPALCPVDLHHRTQQPGCPAPTRPGRFLKQARPRPLGNGLVAPLLSAEHSVLLSAMNLVKALVHREAALGHVCDLARWRLDASDEALVAVGAEASRQGLANTLDVALRAGDILLGFEAPPRLAPALEALAQLAAEPDARLAPWPRRRQILYALCDTKLSFPHEMAWTLIGEGYRRVFNGQAPPAPRPA